MPDTGAPWNIPYVAGTDLVADWPTDSQTLAEAIADALDIVGGLVSTHYAARTTTFATTSTSLTDVTGFNITMTPADAANDIIVLLDIHETQVSGLGTTTFDVWDGSAYVFGTTVRETQDVAGYSSSLAGSARVSAGSTSSRTYQVRMSATSGTHTLYGASLIVMEVKV